MKNLRIALYFFFISHLSFAQGEVINIQTKDKEKSGNYKDILSNMYQIVSSNLTGKDKTLEFNSTLFALKNTANSTSLANYNDRFARNLQFNLKVNLDDSFKYKGFNGGITYAIVNQRDKASANFANSELHQIFNLFSTEIQSRLPALIAAYNIADVNSTIKKILKDEPVANFTVNEIPIRNNITASYDAKILLAPIPLSDGNVINNTALFVGNLHALRTNYLTAMESKALWTMNVDGSADIDGKFNKASVGTVFLRGNKADWNEIDVRAALSYADTLTTYHLPRSSFNAKAGMNFKIGKRPNQISYFEVKATGEYNKIYNNLLPDEKSETISANAEIRIRIAKDVWLPLVVKYDIENSNFLGFLNVTYNFDGL